MGKRFNSTGVCVNRKHYMVDISNKINEIEELIDNEFYFTINKPRQYGKTTTLALLKKRLIDKYIVISCSFEGLGDYIFSNEKEFSNKFLELIIRSLKINNKEEGLILSELCLNINTIDDISNTITEFVQKVNKEVILFIDEVDKSSNNQLFLSFIGMLRSKYLLRELEEDYTFKSVILAGVHDVKSLKLKIKGNDERKYNSPWNIAVNFNVDMSFSVEEIITMLDEYSIINNLEMNNRKIAERIYYFTSGYPFLVSRICQVIDEIIYKNIDKNWVVSDVDKSVKIITTEDNTLFQSIIKNLENNNELYDLVNRILISGKNIVFNILDPIINSGITYGVFKDTDNGVAISNKIFEEVIYNYMASKLITKAKDMSNYMIFNFNKNKEFKEEVVNEENKEIFTVYV